MIFAALIQSQILFVVFGAAFGFHAYILSDVLYLRKSRGLDKSKFLKFAPIR